MNIEDTENIWLKILVIFRVGPTEIQHSGWDYGSVVKSAC